MLYPTNEDRKNLAERFQLLFEPSMQDWEIEIADPEKLPEFVACFLQEELSEGQRVSLAEIIFQSLEELLIDGREDLANQNFIKVFPVIQKHLETLKDTVGYWQKKDFCLSKLLQQAAE